MNKEQIEELKRLFVAGTNPATLLELIALAERAAPVTPAPQAAAGDEVAKLKEEIAELNRQKDNWIKCLDAATAWLWHDGEPPHPWREEWFVALTIYGDRVVLRALEEGHSYDYTTAAGTYMKAKNIKRWAQFPDSQYVPAPAAAPVKESATAGELEQLRHERNVLAEAIRDAAVKAGIARPDAHLTGPHLLMLADDMATVIASAASSDARDAALARFPDTFAVWHDGKLKWAQGEPKGSVCLYTTEQLIVHAVESVKADRAERAAMSAPAAGEAL